MAHEKVSVRTQDGECQVHVLTPTSGTKWPAAIFYMDAGGIRPALVAMAQRLADAGYLVLLPDLFYRFGPYEPLVPIEVFKGDFRAIIGPMVATTSNGKAADDTKALLAYLDTRSDAAGKSIGVTGYCMGGGMALTAAGRYPDRVAAAASFHGGRLATDAPDSPHLQSTTIKAEVYVAGADNDDSYPPEMAERLEQALVAGLVRHRCEIYDGTLHGWVMTDFPVYDEPAAERAWKELLALFARNLPQA